MGLAAVAIALAFVLPGYVEIATSRGVTVLERKGSSAIELAAEGDIDAPVERVRAVLLDYDRHAKFLKNLSESRVIARSPSELVVYQRLSLPVISDRDVVIRVTWGQAGSVSWIRFQTANDRGPPPREHVVRMPVDEGAWQLWPIDGAKRTRARYLLHIDIGGSLPEVLGRGRAGSDLVGLFDAVRAQVAR